MGGHFRMKLAIEPVDQWCRWFSLAWVGNLQPIQGQHRTKRSWRGIGSFSSCPSAWAKTSHFNFSYSWAGIYIICYPDSQVFRLGLELQFSLIQSLQMANVGTSQAFIIAEANSSEEIISTDLYLSICISCWSGSVSQRTLMSKIIWLPTFVCS